MEHCIKYKEISVLTIHSLQVKLIPAYSISYILRSALVIGSKASAPTLSYLV